MRFFFDVEEFVNKTWHAKIILYAVTTKEAMTSCNRSDATVLGEILPDSNVAVGPLNAGKGTLFIVGDCQTTDSTVYHRCYQMRIAIKAYRCGRGNTEHPCANKGVCITNDTRAFYGCRCCPGYLGSFCEELDGCHRGPCKNGGFCIDITEGHDGDTFQCLCPYGYSGRTCEQMTYKCDSEPCRNNGTCSGNQTSYACTCAAGFAGPDCETNVDECASSPCVHGICVDGDDGYQCFCSPGYGGNDCQFEYKECDSSPCINGGSCVEQVGAYACVCGPGYTGNRCQIKIDLCQSQPCPYYKRCFDRGNIFTCECKPGLDGPDCAAKYNVCDPNPCQNEATCWSSLNSFFCACRPGFTGEKCQDVFHLEPIPTMTEQHPEQVELPATNPKDRLHNIYIAVGILASAFLIVLVIVGICHCRVNKTYQFFTSGNCRNISEESDCKRDSSRLKFAMEDDVCPPHQMRRSLDNFYDPPDFADMEAPLINVTTK